MDHTISNSISVDPSFARQRLASYIQEGQARSADILTKLMHEAEIRKDVVVSRDVMSFDVQPKAIHLNVANPALPDPLGFTDWSEDQMLSTLKVSQRDMRYMQEDGEIGTTEATRHLNALRYRIGGEAERNGKSRRLLRVVDNTVKGWLSPTYGLYDQTEILSGFTQALQNLPSRDVLLTGGEITDRRYYVSAMQAQIIQPWEGEFIVVGADLQSSDYGFGAVDLVQKVIRLVCRNGLIGVSFFRKTHQGGKLGYIDSPVFEVSDRTRQLSAAAVVSMLTDGVTAAFGQRAIDGIVQKYQEARIKEINPEAAAKTLREKGILSKEQAEQVPGMMAADVEWLPTTPNKNSALRFGQLLAWMGNQQVNGERSIALMETAGKYTGLV